MWLWREQKYCKSLSKDKKLQNLLFFVVRKKQSYGQLICGRVCNKSWKLLITWDISLLQSLSKTNKTKKNEKILVLLFVENR